MDGVIKDFVRNSMKELTAIVISEDHYNALGVIRSLGECKIPITLVLTTKGNSYVDLCKYVKTTVKIARNKNAIIEALRKITSEQIRYVLFPLSDFAAEALDEHWDELSENITIPHMKGRMLLYQNKDFSKKRAKECGMKVADGKVLDISIPQVTWSDFPAIVKPLVSVDGFKSDITIVSTTKELLACINSFCRKGYKNVLIEKYICGKNDHMVEVMGYRGIGGISICGIISKIREFPIKNGSTSFARIVDTHDSIDLLSIKKYIESADYYGLFDIEFKYANGFAYFIECNFRNGAPGYALTCIGRNIPVCWINSMLAENIILPKAKTHNCLFMCEQTDMLNMLKGNVSFFRWVLDFIRARKIFFSFNDIWPSLEYYIQFLKNSMDKFLRKKRK